MLNKKTMTISLLLILKEITLIFVYMCLFSRDNVNFIVYTNTYMSLYTVHVHNFYMPITSY